MTAPMASAFSEYLFLIQFGPAVLQSVAVLAINIDDSQMRIIYASPLLAEMFGYSLDELHGQSLDTLLRTEDREIHHRHFAHYQTSPTTRTMNAGIWVDGRKKDGTQIKVQVSLCVQPVGRMDCVIACVADVTNAFLRHQPLVSPDHPGHGPPALREVVEYRHEPEPPIP